MLNRIAVVGVPAQDVVRAVHFYRNVLGLRLSPHQAGPPHLRVGDTFLAVFQRDMAAVGSLTPLVAFDVNDLDAEMAMLKERGVVFDGGVRHDGAVRWAMFHDSEGNLLELVQFAGGPA